MTTAKLNGYNQTSIEKLYEKHKKKVETRNVTTLTPVEEENVKFLTLSFYPPITQKLNICRN